MREELADAMLDVFLERGYEEATVEEAARAVGISRATFFRYFGSKEDAVLATVGGSSQAFEKAMTELVLRPSVAVWDEVRDAFQRTVDPLDQGEERGRARLRMIHANAALRSRLAERRQALAPELARALAAQGLPATFATTVATVGLSALDLAWARWAQDPALTMNATLDEVFAELTRAASPLS